MKTRQYYEMALKAKSEHIQFITIGEREDALCEAIDLRLQHMLRELQHSIKKEDVA